MTFGRMLALTLAAMIAAAPTAHAQDSPGSLGAKAKALRQSIEEEANDPTRSGPLLGLGGIYALENFDGIGMSTDDSGGFNATVGYRFNKWVSSDLRVERYVEFDSPTGEVNGWAVGLDARGYYPLGAVQPFGLIGMNYLDMETTNSAATNRKKTDDGPAMRFGIGLDWYVTNNFVLTPDISYMLGFGEVDGYDMVVFSFGFLYRP